MARLRDIPKPMLSHTVDRQPQGTLDSPQGVDANFLRFLLPRTALALRQLVWTDRCPLAIRRKSSTPSARFDWHIRIDLRRTALLGAIAQSRLRFARASGEHTHTHHSKHALPNDWDQQARWLRHTFQPLQRNRPPAKGQNLPVPMRELYLDRSFQRETQHISLRPHTIHKIPLLTLVMLHHETMHVGIEAR
jgi:hypothetical protein